MTSPFPAQQYLIAFNNGPLDDPASIGTVATPAGTLGAANVWTDITPFVKARQGKLRGRQHDYAQFEAGAVGLDVQNDDARFSTWNTASPYAGLMKPRKWLQVRVWNGSAFVARFTGHISAWPTVWADPVSGSVQIVATDPFRLFATANLTGDVSTRRVLLDNPAGFWTCSDAGPPTNGFIAWALADSSGNGHNISIPSTWSYGPPALGYLYLLGNPGAIATSTNTSMSVVAYPSPGLVDPVGCPSGTSFTAAGWMKSTQTSAKQRQLWGVGTASISLLHCGIMIDTSGHVLGVAGGSVVTVGASVNVCDGSWHHVAVTYDVVGGALCAYVDGVLDSTITHAGLTWTPTDVAWLWVDNGTNDDVLAGSFQYLSRWSTALSAVAVAGHYRAGAQLFPQESTDRRINGCLDMVPWPTGARSVDAGASSCVADTSPQGVKALQRMQDCEATEFGALYATGDGKARFVSRHNLWTTTSYRASQVTFGDDPIGSGDVPYQPGPTLGLDDVDIYNDAQGTRQGGVQQQSADQTSIDEYGRQTWTPSGTLLNTTDADVLAQMGAIVGKYKEPVDRIQSLTVDLADLIGTPTLLYAVLGLDVLQRVTVRRVGPPGGGDGFSQQANIESIDETVTADSWTITFGLSLVDVVWVLGVSKLGVDTALGY